MKIGLIARGCNSGLGTLSWEFYNHLKPHKTLVVGNGVYKMFPERYPDAEICRSNKSFSDKQMLWLLEGIDVLITIETPYRWEIYPLARKMGVKTVLIPMYECLPEKIPYEPDHYICPSELDFDEIKSRNKTFLPCPINREKLLFRHRKKAMTFLFNNGHGGGAGRNGASVFFRALKKAKTNKAKFLVHSQVPLTIDDPRVEVRVGNYKNYWDIWGEGDVFVWPHRFDGLSLPVQEALANGMPVLTTNFHPFKGWLPKEWMIPVAEKNRSRIFQREIDVHEPDVDELARMLERWSQANIGGWSKVADMLAEERSWKKLKPKYLKLLRKICST